MYSLLVHTKACRILTLSCSESNPTGEYMYNYRQRRKNPVTKKSVCPWPHPYRVVAAVTPQFAFKTTSNLSTTMRAAFYVAVAVAVFARSSAVAVFASADEPKFLSKVTPDLAADTMTSMDS
ncbi:unnamed protein product [Phytophthora fragariaefolia]|uniref:Unnamed protein product n=1 Tax=Phytophthora fragariaefolia TaxID=1490495 RepID=A0A9W6Y0D3_9STRA|nr:unnamed protein product [Phytophthora fragariaefolia]